MSVLFGFCYTQLFFAGFCHNFTQGIVDVFLIEKYVYALEGGIVRGHGVVFQAERLHTVLWHVFLGQYYSELSGSIVAEIEKEHHVAVLNGGQRLALSIRMNNGFYEFIGYSLIVRCLNSLNHVLCFHSFALYQQIVGFFDALPAFVPVHGIVTAHNRGYGPCVSIQVLLQSGYERLTAFGVGVPAVHKAMHKGFLYVVKLGDFNKLKQMIERAVYAAV